MVGHAPPDATARYMQAQRGQAAHIDMVELRQRQPRRVGEGAGIIKLIQAKTRQHALDLQAPIVKVSGNDQRRARGNLALDEALQLRNLAHAAAGDQPQVHHNHMHLTAVRAAAERWAVPKFYWTVLAVSAFRAGLEALGPQDVPADWIRPPGEVPFGFTDEQITAEIDAQEHLGAKVAAMSAHATQVVVGPTGRAFSLSNKMVLPVLGAEHYVLVAGRPGPVGEHGWETDLLAGLELSGN